MSLTSLQSKMNARLAKKSNLGAVGIAFARCSSLEEKAYQGYMFDKYTDYLIAKAKGTVYRHKYPGKDHF